MTRPPPAKVSDLLTRDEIQAFVTPSNLRGAAEVATTWAIIAIALAAVAVWPHPLTAIAAVFVIGGRQLALAVLMHEAAHRSLFASRRANDLLGRWVLGGPVWSDVARYRTHHLVHHGRTGTDDDPDLGLVTPFPTTRRGLIRKFARDLSGIAGLRRIAALVMMDLELLSYTASTGARWRGRDGRPWSAIAAAGARNLAPTLVSNAALLTILALAGHAWLYALWAAAYLTTFSLFVRIRSIAEHACTARTSDPLRNTRTVLANPVARLFVAPHHVNYHLEHHLLMTAPCYRLPALHQRLMALGALDDAPVATSYRAVLAQACAG